MTATDPRPAPLAAALHDAILREYPGAATIARYRAIEEAAEGVLGDLCCCSGCICSRHATLRAALATAKEAGE
jgi:hypothetical protein